MKWIVKLLVATLLTVSFAPASLAVPTISVKDFGAVGNWNGSVGNDDTTAVTKALNASLGRTLVFPAGNYHITSELKIALGASSEELRFEIGATITSTAPPSSHVSETGAIQFTGTSGSSLTISNGNIVATSAGVRTLQAALRIVSVDTVVLNNTTATGAGDQGAIILYASKKLSVSGGSYSNNIYAGLLFSGCSNVTITGVLASNNGITSPSVAPLYGYGISASSRYNVSIGNNNVSISNNHAYNNWRKGIDVHDGVNVSITGNTVYGFGNAGIYAVYEEPDKYVDAVVISNNVVGNDQTLVDAMGITAYQQMSAIEVGSFGASATNPASFTVVGNVMKGSGIIPTAVPGTGMYGVLVLTTKASSILSVIINDNTFSQASVTGTIYVANTGTLQSVSINGNSISESAAVIPVILADSALQLSVLHNTIAATPNYFIQSLNTVAGNVSNNILVGTASVGTFHLNGATTRLTSNTLNGVFQPDILSSSLRHH